MKKTYKIKSLPQTKKSNLIKVNFKKGGKIPKYQTAGEIEEDIFLPSDYKKIGDEQVLDVVERQLEDGIEKTIYKIQWYLAEKEIENEIENNPNSEQLDIEREAVEKKKKEDYINAEVEKLLNQINDSNFWKKEPIDFEYKDIEFPTDHKIVSTQEEYDKLNRAYKEAKKRNNILRRHNRLFNEWAVSRGGTPYNRFFTPGKSSSYGEDYNFFLDNTQSGADLSKIKNILDPDIQDEAPGALKMINLPELTNITLRDYLKQAEQEGLVPTNKLYRYSEGEYFPVFRQTIPILQENINKQIALKKLGFDIKVDGIWGDESQAAWDNLLKDLKKVRHINVKPETNSKPEPEPEGLRKQVTKSYYEQLPDGTYVKRTRTDVGKTDTFEFQKGGIKVNFKKGGLIPKYQTAGEYKTYEQRLAEYDLEKAKYQKELELYNQKKADFKSEGYLPQNRGAYLNTNICFQNEMGNCIDYNIFKEQLKKIPLRYQKYYITKEDDEGKYFYNNNNPRWDDSWELPTQFIKLRDSVWADPNKYVIFDPATGESTYTFKDKDFQKYFNTLSDDFKTASYWGIPFYKTKFEEESPKLISPPVKTQLDRDWEATQPQKLTRQKRTNNYRWDDSLEMYVLDEGVEGVESTGTDVGGIKVNFKKGGKIPKYQTAGQKYNIQKPKPIGYYQNTLDPEVSESTAVDYIFKPTEEQITKDREHIKRVGDLTKAIKEETGVSHNQAVQNAQMIIENEMKGQPSMQAMPTRLQGKAQEEFSKKVMDDSWTLSDYMALPLDLLSTFSPPSDETRYQRRFRRYNPNTSALDKLKESTSEALSLAPSAALNVGLTLAGMPEAGASIIAAESMLPFSTSLQKAIPKFIPNIPKIGKNLSNVGKLTKSEVRLVPNANRSQQANAEVFDIYKGNERVGEISGNRLSTGDFETTDIGINPIYQKQGIGTTAYTLLNKSLSPGSKVKSWGAFVENPQGIKPGMNTWESMVNKGLARKTSQGGYEMIPEPNIIKEMSKMLAKQDDIISDIDFKKLQKTAFDEGTDFASMWVSGKNKAEVIKEVDKLSNAVNDLYKPIRPINKAIDRLEKQIWEEHLGSGTIYPHEVKDQATYNKLRTELEKLQDESWTMQENIWNSQEYKDIEKSLQDVYNSSIDPEFKRKIQEIYNIAGKDMPSIDASTFSDISNMKDRATLVYMDPKSPSFKNLNPFDQEYLLNNYEKIKGIRTKDRNRNNPGSTITLASRPIIDPKSPSFNDFMKERATLFYNIPEKEVIQEYVSPGSIIKTAVHESGHDSQRILDWLNQIGQSYNPEMKYYTGHSDNPLAKAFKDAMVEGFNVPEGSPYSYQTWLSSQGELHSELMVARSLAAKEYMKQGYSMREAMDIIKNYERQGNDQLFEFYLKGKGHRGLDKHFKETTDYATKKKLIQILPQVALALGVGTAAASQYKQGGSTPKFNFKKGYRRVYEEDSGSTEFGKKKVIDVYRPMFGTSKTIEKDITYASDDEPRKKFTEREVTKTFNDGSLKSYKMIRRKDGKLLKEYSTPKQTFEKGEMPHNLIQKIGYPKMF